MSFRNSLIAIVAAFAVTAALPSIVRADEAQPAAPAAETQPPAADTQAPETQAPAGEAQAPADEAQAPAGDAQAAAPNPIEAALVHGPADVKLGEQAVVKMPKGFAFLPKKQALAVMAELGNHLDPDNFYGLFLSDADAKWFIAATFDDSGYVKDDDQNSINADEILDGMKQGLAQDNEDRKAKGLPEVEIVGWIEKPHYDAKAHHLIWSVEAKDVGSKSPDTTVNYNTLALGRQGFISLNLVTARSEVETDKQQVATLLGNLSFDDGKKYENFDPKTDKIAEYGLIALIGGIAAKKIGLIALLVGGLVKFKAVVVAAAAGIAGTVKKIFRRRDTSV